MENHRPTNIPSDDPPDPNREVWVIDTYNPNREGTTTLGEVMRKMEE